MLSKVISQLKFYQGCSRLQKLGLGVGKGNVSKKIKEPSREYESKAKAWEDSERKNVISMRAFWLRAGLPSLKIWREFRGSCKQKKLRTFFAFVISR